jgi:hypothetical protein
MTLVESSVGRSKVSQVYLQSVLVLVDTLSHGVSVYAWCIGLGIGGSRWAVVGE